MFTQHDPLTDAELDRLGDFLKGCKGGEAWSPSVQTRLLLSGRTFEKSQGSQGLAHRYLLRLMANLSDQHLQSVEDHQFRRSDTL